MVSPLANVVYHLFFLSLDFFQFESLLNVVWRLRKPEGDNSYDDDNDDDDDDHDDDDKNDDNDND